VDLFDLGVGLASREGGGGSGAGDFSLRTDFRESGVGGGTSFGGGSSALVGVLEEYFFRGVLGLAWWRAVGERKAGLVVLVGAVIFAGAHFIRPGVGWDGGDGWGAGFLAWGSLELWSGTGHLWKLAGLVLIGLILARLVWNEQSLAGAIGLHAGWVGGLRWVESACPPVPQAVEGWWGPSLEAGPLPFLLLLIVTLALWGRPIRASLG